MIVTCVNCQTKFKIDDAKIAPNGVRVRCAKCKHLFVVKKDPQAGSAKIDEPPKPAAASPTLQMPATQVPTLVKTPKPQGLPAAPVPPPDQSSNLFDLPSDLSLNTPAAAALDPPQGAPSAPGTFDLDLDEPGFPLSRPSRAQGLAPPPAFASPPAFAPPPVKRSAGPMGGMPAPRLPETPTPIPDLDGSIFSDFEPSPPPAPPAAQTPYPRVPPKGVAAPARPPGKPAPTEDPFAGIDLPAFSGGPSAPDHSKNLFDDLSDPALQLVSPPTMPGKAPGAKPAAAPPKSQPFQIEPTSTPMMDWDQGMAKPIAGSAPPAMAVFPGPATGPNAPSVAAPSALPAQDPFANMEAASGEDLFGGSAGKDQAAPDPFAQLDQVRAPFENFQGVAAEPPPRKEATPAPKAVAVGRLSHSSPGIIPVVSPAAQEPAEKVSQSLQLFKLGFGGAAVLLALLLFVVIRSEGKPDLLSWTTYQRAFQIHASALPVFEGFSIEQLRNTSYPNKADYPLLVLWGSLRNQSAEPKRIGALKGQIATASGEVLAEKIVPIGVSFSPSEVFDLDTETSVELAYQGRFERTNKEIPPGQSVPFMVIFFQHPAELSGIHFRIQPAGQYNPSLSTPTPAPTKPAPAEPAPTASTAPLQRSTP